MKRFAIALILIIFIVGCTQQSDFSQIQENKITEESPITQEEGQAPQGDSDVVQTHPIQCKPQLGFDNYRTYHSFVINPKNNREMYINIEYKGFYKSVDGGRTWSFSGKGIKAWPRSDDTSLPCHQLHFSLSTDPSNQQRLLLPGGSGPGTLSELQVGGLSESLDGGATWHQLFTGDMSAYTTNSVTDPRDGKIIYVATAALPGSNLEADPNKIFVTKGVVYKTVDGGKTWEELPTGFYIHLRVTGLFLNPQNPDHLLISTMGLPPGTNTDKKATSEQWGFLQTKDAGKTWTTLDSTFGIGIRFVDVSPTNFNHFFILASKDNIDKIFYSIDGSSLNEVHTPVNLARYDPHQKDGMRLVGLNVYTQPDDIFESLDGGKTWNPIGKLPKEITNNNGVSNIVFDPLDKNILYLNGDMGRIWKSTDNGKTWELLLSVEIL